MRVEKQDLREISMMMPEKCQATIVRLFVKDEAKFDQAREAFNLFCKEKLGGEPHVERGLSHSQSAHAQQRLSQSQQR